MNSSFRYVIKRAFLQRPCALFVFYHPQPFLLCSNIHFFIKNHRILQIVVVLLIRPLQFWYFDVNQVKQASMTCFLDFLISLINKKIYELKNNAKRNISCAMCDSCTVVFVLKCRLFCLCVHGQCRVYYIYHVEFHFWLRHLVWFPV